MTHIPPSTPGYAESIRIEVHALLVELAAAKTARERRIILTQIAALGRAQVRRGTRRLKRAA